MGGAWLSLYPYGCSRLSRGVDLGPAFPILPFPEERPSEKDLRVGGRLPGGV